MEARKRLRMNESPAALIACEVAKHFGRTLAVAGISFSVSTTEVIALAGGNGSGKSTLLKILAGVIAPTSGHVDWNGQRLLPGRPMEARRRGIEIVFQDLALCPDCSVLENLFLGREPTSRFGFVALREMKRSASEMVDRYRFPIPSLAATPRELSGGQQKAVAIGRALLSKPKFLLLDEPTASLGVKEQGTILRTIGELKSTGVGVILCTHSPDEILAIADRVLVLRCGQLINDIPLDGMSKQDLAILMST
jgi:ABC-type sugar transport system ATPase subunit